MNRTRKRRHEPPLPKQSSGSLIDAIPSPKEQLVVDSVKVTQALAKLSAEETPACIKIPVSDSEAEHFEGLQDSLSETFSVSITISGPSVSLDRIITIYGNLAECSRCSIYIGFILTSSINNFAKAETYTLKSANYRLRVLIEASDMQIESLMKKFPAKSIDLGPYERNLDLHSARLTGDLSSLFNSLTFIYSSYSYKKYASDENIKSLPVVSVYESPAKSYDTTANNQRILDLIYDKSFLTKTEN